MSTQLHILFLCESSSSVRYLAVFQDRTLIINHDIDIDIYKFDIDNDQDGAGFKWDIENGNCRLLTQLCGYVKTDRQTDRRRETAGSNDTK